MGKRLAIQDAIFTSFFFSPCSQCNDYNLKLETVESNSISIMSTQYKKLQATALLVVVMVVASIVITSSIFDQFSNMYAHSTIIGVNNKPEPEPEPEPFHTLLLNKFQITQNAAASIISTTSADYTWIGNSFIAPPGVPTFTPKQIKTYFEGRNVLIIGDSLSRRLHVTLLGIMNAYDLDNIKMRELNQESILNADKNQSSDNCDGTKSRAISTGLEGRKWSVCKDLIVDEGVNQNKTLLMKENRTSSNLTMAVSTTRPSSSEEYDNTQMIIRKTVKYFDQTIQYCFALIEWWWRDADENEKTSQQETHAALGNKNSSNQNRTMSKSLQHISKDYDLVILSLGIWELSSHACDMYNPENLAISLRMRNMLENMKRNNPKDLQVVIRTSGFDSRLTKENNSMMFESNAAVRDFFHNMTKTQGNDGSRSSNLTMVDWGSVISERSFGADKIKSEDRKGTHYGLEGRLLLIQQLMHELVKSELVGNKYGGRELDAYE